MDQRTKFIADYLRECFSITELCERYGVARKTGYKLIDRYLRYGPAGLEERSRKPRHSPNADRARDRRRAAGGASPTSVLGREEAAHGSYSQRHPRWVFAGTIDGVRHL